MSSVNGPAPNGRKAMAGLAAFIIVIGALLFVSAGTLAYWQAWVFLLLFTGGSTLLTLYLMRHDPALLERRMRGGPIAEKEPAQKIIQSINGAGFLAIFIIPALDRRWGWSSVPVAAVGLGEFMILIGLFIIFLVYRENTFASATIGTVPGQKVIATGPYAWVRHPMYAGGLILLLGIPPALGSWWGLIAMVVIFPGFVWRVLDEEGLLARDLPGYADYMKVTTKRLVPGLW